MTGRSGPEAGGGPGGADRARSRGATVRVLALGVASAFLFALGSFLTESIGEIALDVDLKPFFIPYLLIALSRFAIPTLSVGVGAAVGEGLLDVFEGYELEDPIGFMGYVLGLVAFGWYVHEVAEDPTSARTLATGAILGAFVQATFEGVAFVLFATGSGPRNALFSVLGNTVTHGILLGAIPLILLCGPVRDRVGWL